MNQQNDYPPDDVVTEIQAIVDLVDANVSPVADAEAWEAEIAAHQQGERKEPPLPFNETLHEVIELSTVLA
jgi:hypothetical protein